MRKRSFTLVLTLLSFICILSCAKKGTVSGGPKDETPPVFLKALPPNYSTNFNQKEIKIYFDEYIKLKDPQKQIIISPPMDPKPEITPLGSANKYVKIKFLDTLIPNTTYSINFGESVTDNNEGNAFPFFKYVFSTGDQLDSLKISGLVQDAIDQKPDPFITVALYEINETYKDSLVFQEVPRYITSTLDSVTFELDNLRAGTYKLIALKDAVTNYKYEPKQDKIGFYEEVVTLPADTAKPFVINIFKEELEFRAVKPKQISKNEFYFGYEGNAENLKINILSDVPNNFETRIIADKEKDTLHYWFKPFFEADSLVFEVTNTKNFKDTLVARFKDQYKDSIVLNTNAKSILVLNEDFKLFSNTPFEKIDTEKITLTDKDSVTIPFTLNLNKDNNEAILKFEKKEDHNYNLELLPEAITDFVGNVNDSTYFNFRTKKLADYGAIFLTLENVASYPLVVHLTDEKGEVILEKTSKKEEIIVFDHLEPAKYLIRVIEDSNANGKWDTGNFLKGQQPESVSYYPETIEVRANWELKQTFNLE